MASLGLLAWAAVAYRCGVPARSVPLAARDAILAWYRDHGRSLPFRTTNDPYAVLVSEAMAQQTQAARAADAWQGFMGRFPTVQALATASPAEVLRAWQGLGYNRRALNLQRAARLVVERHAGRLPADLDSLLALPGVGPYTARAVSAIAFGQPVGAVDTNVRRVLSRIVAGDVAAIPAPDLQAIADGSVPLGRAADWTHAVMDLGAMVCRSRRPSCETCPAATWCAFAKASMGVEGSRTVGRRLAAGPRPAVELRPAPGPRPAAGPRAGLDRPGPGRPRSPSTAFATTSRWLRGRIVDRLRAAPDGTWTTIEGPIGSHDELAVLAALAELHSEGLIELDRATAAAGPGSRARLPIA